MSSVDPTDPNPSATRAAAPPHSIWRNADLLRVLVGETISDLGSQIGDLALHMQLESRKPLGVIGEKREKIPLWHEGDKFAARGQLREIGDRHSVTINYAA